MAHYTINLNAFFTIVEVFLAKSWASMTTSSPTIEVLVNGVSCGFLAEKKNGQSSNYFVQRVKCGTPLVGNIIVLKATVLNFVEDWRTVAIFYGDCTTNDMITPSLSNVTVGQGYIATFINAFSDTWSASSSPPTCLARTCTSNNSNVVWSNTDQKFTV